jgi:hypothetical protein
MRMMLFKIHARQKKVQKYKYCLMPALSAACAGPLPQVLSLLALLVQKYKY